MADNITLNSGTGGASLASDDISGVQHQRVKVQFGADGSATDVSATAPLPVEGADAENAAITANPLPVGGRYDATPRTLGDGDVGAIALDADGAVQISDGGNTLTVDGTVTADAGTGPWPVTDNGGALTVDWAGTAPPIGAGVEATALRVTLATDSTGVVSVDDNGGSLTVDNAALSVTGGGTEASALRVTLANDSTGVVSVDDGGGNLSVDWGGTTPPIGAGTEATALRVTLATDSTGVVSVDDGGGSLTVDGTVTETNSAAILADTASMDTNLGTLAGAVSGSEMQVDIVGALPAGANSIGTLGANSGVDIGDVDVTSISAGSNLIGDVGLSGARTSGGTTLYKNIDVDESADQVKGTAGQLYWLHAMNLTASPLYLKLYNATAAAVVVGTTVPDLTFPLATQATTDGAGFVLSVPNGIAFSTAITIACTTGLADADAGAPGANACVVNLGYA